MSQIDRQTIDVLELLSSILSRQTDIAKATKIISPNLISHLDGYSNEGFDSWETWVKIIHKKNIPNLRTEISQIIQNDDGTISVRGYWLSDCQGETTKSNEVILRYRIENGIVVEVWSTCKNYTFIFGKIIENRVACFFILFRIWLLNKLKKNFDYTPPWDR